MQIVDAFERRPVLAEREVLDRWNRTLRENLIFEDLEVPAGLPRSRSFAQAQRSRHISAGVFRKALGTASRN